MRLAPLDVNVDIALVAALVEAATRIMELVVEARMLCVLLSFFVRFGTGGGRNTGVGDVRWSGVVRVAVMVSVGVKRTTGG